MEVTNHRKQPPRLPKSKQLSSAVASWVRGTSADNSQTPSEYGVVPRPGLRASSACGFAPAAASRPSREVPGSRASSACGFAPGDASRRSAECRAASLRRPASTPLDEEDSLLDSELEARYRHRPEKRMFPNSPMTQSFVDTVVFGRDMDMSGDSQFDEEYVGMFNGSAGLPSWAEHPEGQRIFPEASSSTWGKANDGKFPPQGLRHYPNAPVSCSVVDQVVFGHDIDGSGDNAFTGEEYLCMHSGAAGVASGVERPRGLSNGLSAKRRARLQSQARLLVSRLHGERRSKDNRAAVARLGFGSTYAPSAPSPSPMPVGGHRRKSGEEWTPSAWADSSLSSASIHRRRQRQPWCSTVKGARPQPFIR